MTTKKTLRTCKNGHQYYKSSDCPTCPICEENRKPKDDFLSILAAPARRALENKGIRTPEHLSKFSEDEILQLHGMGKSSIPKLKKVLTQNGFTFKNKKIIMPIIKQIKEYITTLPEPKRTDIDLLHKRLLQLFPNCKLWFLDGKNDKGKIVSNPNIGYGVQTIKYADGKTKEFYQIGISANTTGISVYTMGIEDKKYLADTFGKTIGKASVTGYCIKFKTLQDINIDVLEKALQDCVKHTS